MRRYDQDFLQEMIGEELNLLALGPQLNSKYSFISSELILEDNYKFYFKKYLLTRNNDYEILKEICFTLIHAFISAFSSSELEF